MTLLILIITGCNDTAQPEKNEPTPVPPVPNIQQDHNKGPTFTYEEYRGLFKDLSQNLELSQFSYLESTDGSNIVAIEKDWSFDTRSMLTLNGKPSDEETQERIIYKKNDGSLLLVDLIYMQYYLGNDLILWPTQETNANQKEDVLKSLDEALLTYQNILVKITLISKEEKNKLSDMQTVLQSVTTFLRKY